MAKDKILEKLESEYYLKHNEMEKLEKKSHILNKYSSKDQEFQNFLLNSKKKRLLKRKLEEKSFFSFFYFKYLIYKNPDFFALLLIDLNANIILHPLNTIKVRIQAQNKLDDVSNYLKNNVQKKSLFLGVKYSYFIAGIQSFVFSFTQKILFHNPLNLSQKQNLLTNFIITDILTSPLRYLFENRKMALQMDNSSQNLKNLFGKYQKTFFPFLLRDLTFRFSFYIFNFEFIKDMGNGSIHFLNFIFATLFACFVSAPFDIVATKISTQEKTNKYNGTINTMNIIIKEEKFLRLISGFSIRYVSFVIGASLNLLFFFNLRELTKNSFSIDNLLDK